MGKRNVDIRVAGGMSFTSLLAIVFIVLKLLGHISWSWWWVLSPIWIELAILVLILVVLGIITVILDLIDYEIERK
ncbi:hypothetical protein MUP59_08215 [Candidatus Bathyarchaeota archaeon]|nr:hypothetical protein [Candidatus Bathyarchaeota archaeon]